VGKGQVAGQILWEQDVLGYLEYAVRHAFRHGQPTTFATLATVARDKIEERRV
jgi:hypothetical protein